MKNIWKILFVLVSIFNITPTNLYGQLSNDKSYWRDNVFFDTQMGYSIKAPDGFIPQQPSAVRTRLKLVNSEIYSVFSVHTEMTIDKMNSDIYKYYSNPDVFKSFIIKLMKTSLNTEPITFDTKFVKFKNYNAILYIYDYVISASGQDFTYVSINYTFNRNGVNYALSSTIIKSNYSDEYLKKYLEFAFSFVFLL